MEQKRFFGTYNGEMVEYRAPLVGDMRYVILKSGKAVIKTEITPSPYPWQFHTREFWDAHPGMRWAAYSAVRPCWVITAEKPSNENWHWSFVEGQRIYDVAQWQGEPLDSLFENPFFRHYPAELDDPAWWRKNAPEWATCGTWDEDGEFFFFKETPQKYSHCWGVREPMETFPAMDSRYTGTWDDCPLIMRPAAKVPMVKHPKAAPKRAGKPLSVHCVNTEGIVFVSKTEAAREWLNEQAPMFGTFAGWMPDNGDRCTLHTDTPHIAMRYLVDGFYNRQPDVIRKHYPDVTAEPENKPRIETRTIERVMKMGDHVLFVLSESPIYQTVTIPTTLDLMQRFGVLSYTDLIGKQIAVRIDADKLVIVEG